MDKKDEHRDKDVDAGTLAVEHILDTADIQSDYDLEKVDVEERQEFIENLAKIETEHGLQWDFCTCAIKNDSINKAFSQPVSDAEFDRLSARFDIIDQRCQAYRVQDGNRTPDERARHMKKIKDCLEEAGIDYNY